MCMPCIVAVAPIIPVPATIRLGHRSKAVAASEMQQEIVDAHETLSQEYAAKTGERVRMVQELRAKLAALDHHLSVIA